MYLFSILSIYVKNFEAFKIKIWIERIQKVTTCYAMLCYAMLCYFENSVLIFKTCSNRKLQKLLFCQLTFTKYNVIRYIFLLPASFQSVFWYRANSRKAVQNCLQFVTNANKMTSWRTQTEVGHADNILN